MLGSLPYCLGALIVARLLPGAAGDFVPPHAVVDLHQEPEHRWDHIIARYKSLWKPVIAAVLEDPQVKVLRALAGNLSKVGAHPVLPPTQLLEVRGMARGMDIDVNDALVLSAVYDLSAAGGVAWRSRACTSIVAQSARGEILHARNLDYNFPDALRTLTLTVDFVRDNRTLFTAVTFGPVPVTNTAVRYGAFSVSQDERDRGVILQNWMDTFIEGRVLLFAEIRRAMEECESYEDAVKLFSRVPLSAASYLILAGTKPGEGAVITRGRGSLLGRDADLDVWRLDAASGRWYLLQTNYDHWSQPPQGDDRRDPGMRAMNAVGPEAISLEALWDVLSVQKVGEHERGILNNETIYTSLMQAALPGRFATVVRQPAPGSERHSGGSSLLLV